MDLLEELLPRICLMVSLMFYFLCVNYLAPKKRFQRFLKKANQDSLLKPLLDEITSRGIKLVPYGVFTLISSGAILRSNIFKEEIGISDLALEKILKKDGRYHQLFLLWLLHELGHFEKPYVFTSECNPKGRDCLFQELEATKDGLKIIEKISGKNKEDIFTKDNLNEVISVTLKQCKKCLVLLAKNPKKCLSFEELKNWGIINEKGEVLTKIL